MKTIQFIISLTTFVLNGYGQDWELATFKNGITVYTKLEENSPIKAFKAEVDISSTMDEILKTITNLPGYANWYDHCKSASILSNNTDSLVYHMEFSMPFPFNNRDVVNSMVTQKIENKYIIDFQQIIGVKNEVNGLVRMPISTGNWILTPKPNGVIHIVHQYTGDPAGNIPTSMVNMLIVSGPINTLTRLKMQLEHLDE